MAKTRFTTRSTIKAAITRLRKEGVPDLTLRVGAKALKAHPEMFEGLDIKVIKATVSRDHGDEWLVSISTASRYGSHLGSVRPTWLLDDEVELYGHLPIFADDAARRQLVERLRGDLTTWLTEELDALEVPTGVDVAVDSYVWLKLAAVHEQHGTKAKLRMDRRTLVHSPWLDIAGRRVRAKSEDLRSRFDVGHHVIWADHWAPTAPMVPLTATERETLQVLARNPRNGLTFDGLVAAARALERDR